jgi:type I restriction enzyme M protein
VAATCPGWLPRPWTAIEAEFKPLDGVLPEAYGIFEPKVLEDLMRLFNSAQIKQATGDVFGRIYEYFLAKFSIQKAHDNGEFFTPSSLVQTIVNVIEPDHGTVFDPACGSGGMFVQSSHFIEHEGGDTARRVVFYGQEKNRDTIHIAQMNLAVHGLEGKIAEAIIYYQDEHTLVGKYDFVMGNPPFNVDLVDAERIKSDPRLPFSLPGVNKDKKVSNGNYLWISYFWGYLNDKGRAGFVVMSSQASNAGHSEKEVRKKIVETGDVDMIISIRSNFFYTRTVPCELWFFDRAKPTERKDKVLMLDARQVYRKVTRTIYDFSPEQMQNLSCGRPRQRTGRGGVCDGCLRPQGCRPAGEAA